MKILSSAAENVGDYDIVLSALGFEERSRFVAENCACFSGAQRFAIGFTVDQVLSFEENRRYFESATFEVMELSDEALAVWWRNELAATKREGMRIAIDVSSFSRSRIASLLAPLLIRPKSRNLEVHLFYSEADLGEFPSDPGILARCAPVAREFAGWSTHSDLPPTAIVGLGATPAKALGIVEYLEPGDLWLFRPYGGHDSYDGRLRESNGDLLEEVEESKIVRYDVRDWASCVRALDSVVKANVGVGRVVIVGSGPKCFLASACIVAAIHHPTVGVFVGKSAAGGAPVQRFANGTVSILRIEV